MKLITNLFRVAWKAHPLIEYVPQRGLKFQIDMKWVKPQRNPSYYPEYSGDLASMKYPDKNMVHYKFQDSVELADAGESVKKLFTFEYQPYIESLNIYEKELVDRVKQHEFDTSSEEVKIAKMTAKIRYYQPIIINNVHLRKQRRFLKELIEIRKKKIRQLRLIDYKRFEWLLDKLDLEYKPCVSPNEEPQSRRKALTLLVKLKVLKMKEEKVAALKKAYDEEKIPFLEKKLEKLKWIKETEEKNDFERTVTDEDIEECIKKIEEVKLHLEERRKVGYVRKIHPYFLEPYYPDLLKEKEKAGALKRP